MTTLIGKLVGNDPLICVGFGGNVYVICKVKSEIEIICFTIDKAVSSIYWNKRHRCYAIRIKNKIHKAKLAMRCGNVDVDYGVENDELL